MASPTGPALTLTPTATDIPTDWDIAIALTDSPGDSALIDFGDGTRQDVPLVGGNATIRHVYPVRTATYTVTGTVVSAHVTWDNVKAEYASWDAIKAKGLTWNDLSGLTRGSTTVTVTVPAVMLAARPVYDPAPAVDVQVHAPSGTWALYRVTDAGRVLIYNGIGADLQTVRDTLAPLNTPVRYELGGTDSNTVTLTGQAASGCWVTSLATGATARCTIQGWPLQTWGARVNAIPIPGRRDLVVLYDLHTLPGTSIVFRTATEADYDAIEEILLSGRIYLRTQPASSLRTVTAIVGQIDQARLLTGDGTSWLFQHGAALQITPTDDSRAGKLL